MDGTKGREAFFNVLKGILIFRPYYLTVLARFCIEGVRNCAKKKKPQINLRFSFYVDNGLS
ncbi:hypothetical protein DSECCO2_410200 [anaerobic digester metagenome]